MASGFFGAMRADKQNAPELWVPLIHVALASGAGTTIEDNVLALIDTGADVCYIDNDLAKKNGLVPTKHVTTYTGTGSKDNPLYSCIFVIKDQPQIKTLIMPTVAGVDLSSNGMNHRVLLGMDALRYFDLRISRSKQIVEMDWVERS